MLLGGFGQVMAARLGELAMAAILNLAGFKWTAAGLCGLTMGAILCGLAAAAVLRLDVLELVAAARGCELAIVVILKTNGGLRARLKWEVLGWRVHDKDLWVNQAMAARQRDLKLATVRVWEQWTELAH